VHGFVSSLTIREGWGSGGWAPAWDPVGTPLGPRWDHGGTLSGTLVVLGCAEQRLDSPPGPLRAGWAGDSEGDEAACLIVDEPAEGRAFVAVDPTHS